MSVRHRRISETRRLQTRAPRGAPPNAGPPAPALGGSRAPNFADAPAELKAVALRSYLERGPVPPDSWPANSTSMPGCTDPVVRAAPSGEQH
eukprot:14071730-Alexandrium_andersonii.AAC.1